ncbi:MAG: CoA pyrophosphatase [Bacteroidetes bacterium]|nr:CoA pyrophosphatase [Bacteroidota bacterium]
MIGCSPAPSADLIRKRIAGVTPHRRRKEGYRRAAVLIPLLPAERDWDVLLTRRDHALPHHRGQIAFPGGSIDEGEDCLHAALREAEEEIGLQPSRVDILGCHDDIWTPSGFMISPVVGLINDPGTLTPNPVEVARIFTVPLSFFADEENVVRQTLRHQGVDREVFFYSWEGETIWGATALMLRNLLGLLGMIDHDAQRIA